VAGTKRAALLAVLLLLGTARAGSAGVIDSVKYRFVEHRLAGQLLDFTANHHRDNRIWAPSLCQFRDLYVYLPPCYDPALKYPVIFYMHGFAQDERSFLDIVPHVDAKIRCGCMPPAVVVAIDGTFCGRPRLLEAGSFYINSNAGRFEDYVMCDVWNWAFANFSLRPERQAHVLAGPSMGGGAAYNLGLKHRDRVGVVAGIFPPLNVRWLDCHGRYMGNFDPCCWGWREHLNRRTETIGCYFGGLVRIPIGRFIDPLFGFSDEAVARLALENPIEHLDRYNVQNGELAMYVAYGGKDNFNLDAQIESFLYVARCRGIHVDVDYERWGHHNQRTAFRLLPGLLDWVGAQLRPYGPTP
jgi:hypothetical protein